MEYQKPIVTVVTVCYNSEKTIAKTIESVLNQSYKNYEYLIIDGNSTDKTNLIINQYKDEFENIGVKLVHTIGPDTGIYDAMNKGIDLSKGTWLNFMNSDDTFYNEQVLSNIFSTDYEGVDIIYGDENRINRSTNRINRVTCNIDLIKKIKFFCHQSTFVRTDLLKENKFDLQFSICSDYDCLLNLYLKNKKFKHVDVIVSNYSTEGISNKSYYRTNIENYHVRKKHDLIKLDDIQIKIRAFYFAARHLLIK